MSAASFATPTKLSRASLRSNTASPFRTPANRAAGQAGSHGLSSGPAVARWAATAGSDAAAAAHKSPLPTGSNRDGPAAAVAAASSKPHAPSEQAGLAAPAAGGAAAEGHGDEAAGGLTTIRESLASSEGSVQPTTELQQPVQQQQPPDSPDNAAASVDADRKAAYKPASAAAATAGSSQAPLLVDTERPPSAAGSHGSRSSTPAPPTLLQTRVRALAAEEGDVGSPHSAASWSGSPLLAHHGAGKLPDRPAALRFPFCDCSPFHAQEDRQL